MMDEFKDIKVGDEVAIQYRYTRVWRIEKVTATTATQIGVGVARYMRSTGRKVGDGNSYYSESARPYTDELRADIADEVARQALVQRIRLASRALHIDASNIDRVEALIAEAAAGRKP